MAGTLATRLRLIQANFADDPASERQGYLQEELERTLKDISPAKRRAVLQELREKFPNWQSSEAAPPQASAPAINTPEAALEKFLELSAGLTPEARVAFSRKLQTAGFNIVQSGGGALPELSPEALRQLGLGAEQQPTAERALKLLVKLAEVVLALDQLAWRLWKQVAPKSTIRKETDFVKVIGPYLSGDLDTSTPVVVAPMEKTRRLIASMLGAMGPASSGFAKKHVSRFSPEAIEELARLEKKWNESLEFAAWRKYCELYKERSTEPALEIELQQAVTKAVEDLMRLGAA